MRAIDVATKFENLKHDFSRAIWNKQALVNFFKIALALRDRAILLVFKKNYSCLFIPNCTRNHVITYTNISIRNEQQPVPLELSDQGYCYFSWMK